MAGTLYIPKTLLVGFQARTDTFTGKLAYVIYKDHTGKIRKEASWNGWRDHKIETLEIENTPTPNFTLNKGVQRSREWFGTGRSMVRVWDPRDFEFEITVDNLLNVLMHADVSKRDITEPCVYAWQGTNLVLLPTNSVEYQESLTHTEKQGVKTSAKDLVVGHTYGVKRDSTTRVVYLGRLDRFDVDANYHEHTITSKQKPKKYHVFIDENTKEVFARDPSALVAGVISDEMHPNFAALMDTYYSSAESQPVIGAAVRPSADRYGNYGTWFEVDGQFVELRVTENNTYVRDNNTYNTTVTVTVDEYATFDPKLNGIRRSYTVHDRNYYSWSSSRNESRLHNPTSLTPEKVADLIKRVQDVALQFMPSPEQTHDWEANRQRTIQRGKALVEQFGCGHLAFILADGKLAADHTT